MVEPMGFEPTTFPVSPGRAQQSFDELPVLLALEVLLPPDGLAACGVGGGADGIRTHDLLDAITDRDKNGGEQK